MQLYAQIDELRREVAQRGVEVQASRQDLLAEVDAKVRRDILPHYDDVVFPFVFCQSQVILLPTYHRLCDLLRSEEAYCTRRRIDGISRSHEEVSGQRSRLRYQHRIPEELCVSLYGSKRT